MKSFKQFREDAMAVGPTNVVGTGSIAGAGGKDGEPGVHMKKKKTPILMPIGKRKPPKI